MAEINRKCRYALVCNIYLLDTNNCIYIINKKLVQVVHRITQLEVQQVKLSAISLGELEYGVSKSKYPQKNKLALLKYYRCILSGSK